jgi:uncharacterized protein (TIGR02246 family)
MMRSIAVLLAFFSVVSCAPPEPDTESMEREIRATLERQVSMWNRGDIEGFMDYYWKSDAFTFQSGDRRLEGWDQLLAMYRANYAGEKRGTLDFSDIEVTTLSHDAAYVIGRWRVVAQDTTKAGLFTLIVRRIGGEWRITHDHSS